MQSEGPFLAVPINATVARDGRLLLADLPLLRLHIMAGGNEGGVIALPELFNLAHLAMTTGIKLERAIEVADSDHDIRLWVEATPIEDACQLAIIGWQEQQAAIGNEDDGAPNASDAEPLVVDPNLTVISGPAWLSPTEADTIVGSHIATLLQVEPTRSSDLPLVDALSDRTAVNDWEVQLAHSGKSCLLTLKPVWAEDHSFMGFAGSIARLDPADVLVAEKSEAAPQYGLNFGEQLAPILKQPLSRIIANAQTISSRLNGPLRESYATYAQDIANAARHLAELVSDIEDLSAIDRPDFVVAQDRIELGDIARRVTGLLALKASDHQISIILPPEGQHVEAVAEFRRVLQIVLNLVGNAIRYAPDGSSVMISISNDSGAALLTVSDQGSGIAVEDRERVFEKFERLGRSGDGGSGLGLYISRRLARAMRGELSVTESTGGGACFELRLPVSEG
jgi:nitrogen-specific signal transduction histidine kinase